MRLATAVENAAKYDRLQQKAQTGRLMLPGMKKPELEVPSQDEVDDVDMYDLFNDPADEAEVDEEDDVDLWDLFNDSSVPSAQPTKRSQLALPVKKQSVLALPPRKQ